MPRVALVVIVLLALMAPQLVFSPTASSQDAESVASGAKPSVGVVLADRPDGVFSGTAFMAADRFVLTAYHVVEGARRILLKFPDYPAVDARMLGGNSNDDVAVLGIPGLPVHPLPLGDVGQVREGQRIVVIGFPRIEVLGAQTATVTEGIVSAIRPGLLQIQAPMSPGNSGGPVLNLKGEVIGIVRGTLRGEQQGINFAAQINTAKPLLGAAVLAPPPSPPIPPVANQPVSVPPTSAVQSNPVAVSPFQILPGQGIGPIRLGMPVEQVATILGSPKGTHAMSDESVIYTWFEPPSNAGPAMHASKTGVVLRVWVLNDKRYTTKEGLHAGSTEAEVRAALGAPSEVREDSQNKTRELLYGPLGVWFTIQLNSQYSFFNLVYDIGVFQPR